MEQLGASLRREVVQEEGRFRQVYISFYTAKVNQLALRFRQGGSEPAIQVPGVSAPQLQGLTRICLAKVVSWMLRGWRKRSRSGVT